MALTITGNTLNGNASGFNGYSIGKKAVWILEITNTSSYYGQTVYFNPALFIDQNLPFEFTNILPQFGFSATLPLINTTTTAALLPDTSQTNINYECKFSLTSEFVLEVRLEFVFTEDIDNFTDLFTLNQQDRFQKNTVNSPNRFVNDITPSVYNTERALRGHFVIGNISTGAIIDQTHADFLTEARWYDSGVAGGSPEFTDWSVVLEDSNGDVTDKLSAFNDTTIKVQVDIGAGTIDIGFGEIVIYRDDISASTTDYIQALEAGVQSKSLSIFGIDYVSSFLGWSLVAGTVYEGEFVIDSTKINSSGSYRIITVAANVGNTVTGSYQSRSIEASELPYATAGTMTGTMFDYNNEFIDKNCLQVAPYERIKACSEVDKSSYLTELGTKGLPGDFDTNFFSYEVVIYDSLNPSFELLRLNDKQSDAALTIVDTFDSYQACVEFRIPPEFSNTAFAIDHIFTYKITLAALPYDDVITFRQLVNARGLDESDAVTDELLIRMDFFDGNGDPVIEICEDFITPLRVEIEKNTTVPDYNLIAMLKPDEEGLIPEEEEDYNNTYLDQLNTNKIIAVDILFGVDDIANFTVDIAQLEKDVKYRMIAVAKEENPSPPTPCPVINIQSNTEVLSSVDISGDIVVTLDVDFAITEFAPSTVSTVDINTTTDPKGKGPNQNNAFVTDTGTYAYIITWDGGFVNDPIVMVQDITVVLANGCTYQVTLNHTILPIVGRLTNENENVNAD